MWNGFLKLDLKKKIIISLLIFLIIVGSLIYFVVLPTVNDIKGMGKQIEDQLVDLEKRYIKGQSLKQLNENLKQIEPQMDKLDSIFVSSNRDLEFITTLEEKADINGVTEKINFDQIQTVENQPYKKMPLRLFTQGEFKNQMNFLASLEALSYYINIKSIELSSAPNGTTTGGNSINMFITADTYWQ